MLWSDARFLLGTVRFSVIKLGDRWCNRMDNGMEGMLDTYLFETNSLLDRLDEMLVNDEKIGDL